MTAHTQRNHKSTRRNCPEIPAEGSGIIPIQSTCWHLNPFCPICSPRSSAFQNFSGSLCSPSMICDYSLVFSPLQLSEYLTVLHSALGIIFYFSTLKKSHLQWIPMVPLQTLHTVIYVLGLQDWKGAPQGIPEGQGSKKGCREECWRRAAKKLQEPRPLMFLSTELHLDPREPSSHLSCFRVQLCDLELLSYSHSPQQSNNQTQDT